MSKGILTVISGFSGAGKGTLVNGLLDKYKNYALSISATTRQPRPGEKDGVQYFFKSKNEFQDMIAEDAFIEYACYVEHYYGTPRAYVEEQLARGKDVILEIEVQGALEVKRKFHHALLLFVTPPSAEELEGRLVNRGTETPEVIRSRMARAAEEAHFMKDYDYIVVNDKLEECVEHIHGLIQMQHQASGHQTEFIEKIQKELREREENRL